jgi:hypothetical protein
VTKQGWNLLLASFYHGKLVFQAHPNCVKYRGGRFLHISTNHARFACHILASLSPGAFPFQVQQPRTLPQQRASSSLVCPEGKLWFGIVSSVD